MEKNKKITIILAIGMVICVALGLVGIYYFKTSEEKPNVKDESDISSTVVNDMSSYNDDSNTKYVDLLGLGIKDFPANKTDAEEIILSDFVSESIINSNFANEKSEFKGIKFDSSCVAYCDDKGDSNHEYYSCDEEDKKVCIVTKTTINDNIEFNSYDSRLYVSDKYIFLIIYNTSGLSQQSIKVYDKNYNMVFEKELIFTEIFDENDNSFKVNLVIKGDILHYITMNGEVNDETVKYVKVDLNKSTAKEEIITIFKAGYSYEG